MNKDKPIDAFPNSPGLSKSLRLMKKHYSGIYKGVWPFRYRFISICSRHYTPSPDCDMCATGRWSNTLKSAISSMIYKRFPTFWRYWVNRRQESYSYWKNWGKENNFK